MLDGKLEDSQLRAMLEVYKIRDTLSHNWKPTFSSVLERYRRDDSLTLQIGSGREYVFCRFI